MSSESFEKFMENLSAHHKVEGTLTGYEKFGNKTKNARRKMVAEHAKSLKSAPATLDLHGRTVAAAEKLVSDFIGRAARPLAADHGAQSLRALPTTVIIITGRSGKLRALFPEWATGFLAPYISSYRLMPTGGSFEVVLKKKPAAASA
ncbi:MAG: Smr/MutS family protein [Proteobacteria bacterium]|nr:Smr/MutS family protein [Pseudomonadota bacterium]